MSPIVTTGYYRFTDIIFEWHQALPTAHDIGPLKAVLAYDALVHPDHPLRKPGVDGIELTLGTFANGEARLLFSSAQIEYLRYWLHAMKLTPEPIPIPSSDYLITGEDLAGRSPVVYSSATDLKKAFKRIDKDNKKLKGTGTLLTSRRITFERVRTLWAAKKGTWMALDFEAWDRDHTMLTEVGWSIVQWAEDGSEVVQIKHLIVRERRGYTNTYVPSHPDKFRFGESELVDKKTFRTRIQELIEHYRTVGPLFLVFHDNSQDVKYLRSAELQAVSALDYVLPDFAPSTGTYVVDTADLFAALEGHSGADKRSLERICRLLQIKTEFLHNAGNDAHYTMLALKSMASGDPVDQQRDKRWPNQTPANNPKVEFQPYDEDSDYSDMEGVAAPIPSFD